MEENLILIAQIGFFELQNILYDSSSEEDDEAIDLLFKELNKNRVIKIPDYVEKVVTNYNNRQFQSHFRMTREAFNLLLTRIAHLLAEEVKGRKQVDPQVQLLSVIWLLANQESYRSVGERFNLPKSVLSRTFVKIVNILNSLTNEYIKWPSPQEEQTIERSFFNMSRLPGIVGAVDGMYVEIKAPQINPESYINRKIFYGVTLQGICDNNLMFTDCFVGYPSSVHDCRIFKNSPFYVSVSQNINAYFEDNQYIIGDKAYPIMKWCITPYIDRGNMTREKIRFNTVHTRAHQVIERSFGLLVGRFWRLKFLDMNRQDLIPATILACCILHNICLRCEDLMINDYIQEGQVNVEVESEPMIQIGQWQENGLRRRNILCNNLH